MSWEAGLGQVEAAAPAIGGILGLAVLILVGAAFAGLIVSGLSRSRDEED